MTNRQQNTGCAMEQIKITPDPINSRRIWIFVGFNKSNINLLTVSAVIPGKSLSKPMLGFMLVWTVNLDPLLERNIASHSTARNYNNISLVTWDAGNIAGVKCMATLVCRRRVRGSCFILRCVFLSMLALEKTMLWRCLIRWHHKMMQIGNRGPTIWRFE